MSENIQKIMFRRLNLGDSFFDSLREAYSEFDEWFSRKANTGEEAYVLIGQDGSVRAFLYVKEESGCISDVAPPINTSKCLKVGTFKVNSHGTRLGERFVKKIFDEALVRGIKHIYTTVFPEHEYLIEILKKYGFKDHGMKITPNGEEKVFLKDMTRVTGDILIDYPTIVATDSSKWLLSIYPEFHTRLFPDSILRTEEASIIQDLSHSNSIHKVYIAYMRGMEAIRTGDCLVIYRTAEQGRKAWFTSVATSLCVVEEMRSRSSFRSEREFIQYSEKNSVFSQSELSGLYRRRSGSEMQVIRMTYNVALPKRPNRKHLVEDAGLDHEGYWGFRSLSEHSFSRIIEMGNVYEGVVIN